MSEQVLPAFDRKGRKAQFMSCVLDQLRLHICQVFDKTMPESKDCVDHNRRPSRLCLCLLYKSYIVGVPLVLLRAPS